MKTSRRPKSNEEVLNGKEDGIRYICKEHWWLSVRKPCAKCMKELDLASSGTSSTSVGRVSSSPVVLEDTESNRDIIDKFNNTKLF